jgi:hypothetical protein
MSTAQIASLLLIGRILSMYLMVSVIRRQWILFKIPIDKDLVKFRKILLLLSSAIVIGNLIPILIDLIAIVYSNSQYIARPNAISVIYAVSNNLTAVLSAFFIWALYKLADRTAIIVEEDKVIALKVKKESSAKIKRG